MKKRFIAVTMAGLLSLSLIGSVSAAGQVSAAAAPTVKTTSAITPRAEQTEWRYRIVNGQWQKRLWSITEGKWLTDWVNV